MTLHSYIEPLTLTERGDGSRDEALEAALFDHFANRDCVIDLPETEEQDDLTGLTIIDHPHITACGTVAAIRN